MMEFFEKWILYFEEKYKIDIHYIIRSNFWVYTRMIITLIGSLLVMSVFTRLSTKEIFGNYNLILSILAVVSLVSLPGLNNSVLFSVAKGYEGVYKKAVKVSFLWSLIGIPILLGIGIYYFYFDSQTIALCFILSSFIFPFMYAPNTYDSFLLGKKRFDLAAYFSIGSTIFYTITMVVLLYFFGNNLVILVAGNLLSSALIIGISYFYSWKYIENSKHDPDCIPYGYFLSSTNVVGTIAANIDKIVIGMFLGPADLAVYSIGIAIPIRIKDFLKIGLSPITPKLCQDSVNEKKILEIFKRLIVPLVGFLLIIAIIYWIFIGPFILLFFGPSYSDAILYSKILLIMIVLSVWGVLIGTFAVTKQKKTAIVLGFHVYPFLRILIFIICMYFFGVLGAVWALCIETGVQILMTGIGIYHDNKTSIG